MLWLDPLRLHFACLDLSNDWLHWSHPLSFIAATFALWTTPKALHEEPQVYFGFFLVSNIYGGGAPTNLLPFIEPRASLQNPL